MNIDWESIETVPENEHVQLGVFIDNGFWFQGRGYVYKGRVISEHDQFRETRPTHWHRLLEPPDAGGYSDGDGLLRMYVDKLELIMFVCPYCAAQLQDERDLEQGLYYHKIPGTGHRFICQASKVRDYFAERRSREEVIP